MNLTGLLLAAGRGRRMGGNKQFHVVQTPSGEKPLVAAAFDSIASVCYAMIVVLGHRADEVAAALVERTFETVHSDPDAPMINSIKVGLHAAIHHSRRATLSGFCSPPPRYSGEGLGEGLIESRIGSAFSHFLLQLGDHPALGPATLDLLLALAAENPDKAVMPSYNGRGGHPVIIPHAIAEKILESPCPGGLRQFWLDHPELCLRIPVDDEGVIRDIDAIV